LRYIGWLTDPKILKVRTSKCFV